MTPERQKWWNSLPTEEKRARCLIKTLKGNINCCKSNIADELTDIANDSKIGKNQLKAAKDNLRDTKHAIKALRKQIAMRPFVIKSEIGDFEKCPHCSVRLIKYFPHCACCGQKLRWD